MHDIARKVGISLSTVHFILKKHLKLGIISARWVPHLLTDEQKRQQVKVAEKLLQMFPTYDNKRTFGPWIAHLRMTVYKGIGKHSSSQSPTMNFDRSAASIRLNKGYVDKNNRM